MKDHAPIIRHFVLALSLTLVIASGFLVFGGIIYILTLLKWYEIVILRCVGHRNGMIIIYYAIWLNS